MKVRILKDLPRTIDGKKIGPFTAGQELEMDDAQATVFIGSAMAEQVLPEPVVEEEGAVPELDVTFANGEIHVVEATNPRKWKKAE